MIDIQNWTQIFLEKLHTVFPDRIWFIGLQGSYGRSEATETSDIDIVVILNNLSAADLKAYHTMLDTLPHRELICGFLSGKQELMNWEPSDLFQFYHDTTPIQGNMDNLLGLLDTQAVTRAIKIGACNLYHGCVHNLLHDKSEEILKGLYKSASFTVQAIYYLQSGSYIRCQKDLRELVDEDEKQIIDTFLHLKAGKTVEFQNMSETLFAWAKKWINETN
jgi:predicted nucleotidyltransferase